MATRRRNALTFVAAIASAIPIFVPLEFSAPPREAPVRSSSAVPAALPGARAIRTASRYAARSGGLVSFATVDSRGRLRGHDMDRLYPGASVVKAMLLAAELQRLADAGESVDPATDSLLSSMIRFSDNEAADAVYARSGDAGLIRAAERAGMRGFTIAGHWGNAQITASDMARFFAELDRVLPRRHRDYGRNLLASVTGSQRWGIPAVAGGAWEVRFKGGWLPDHALVHQAAELRERGGSRKLAIAVLTDQQPSFGYGVEIVQGVAQRLLD